MFFCFHHFLSHQHHLHLQFGNKRNSVINFIVHRQQASKHKTIFLFKNMRVEYSTVINAPIDKVWKIIRVFAQNWNPESPILFTLKEGAAQDQVGAIRNINVPQLGDVVERLEALDDRNYRLCYAILSSPFPVKDYVAEYQAFAVTEGDRTFVRWFSTFEPNQELGEFNPTAVFTSIYKNHLGDAAKILGAQ